MPLTLSKFQLSFSSFIIVTASIFTVFIFTAFIFTAFVITALGFSTALHVQLQVKSILRLNQYSNLYRLNVYPVLNLGKLTLSLLQS